MGRSESAEKKGLCFAQKCLDNFFHNANKARNMLLYLKRSFVALTASMFLPLCNIFIQPHLECALQASHPITRRKCIGKGVEARSEVRERALACPVASCSPTVSTILP